MQLDRVAAVNDIGDVDRDSPFVDHHAATFRDRSSEGDAQMIGRDRIGAADHNGLVSILDIDAFQARKHGQCRVLAEFVRRAPVDLVG